ncbi:MAG: glucosaminidase domain-containing protein, partial [Chloroflexota bacterium]|nr:glucosaminidase domain-containing protein [Chloroflexota bacterium]
PTVLPAAGRQPTAAGSNPPARPRVAGPRPDHRLTAPPSVSAATIDRVLAQYGSPAAGSGALFYDGGVQAGIDPAYALAFYIQESSAGTQGVARFTHSIGNIRVTAGYPSYEGYRSYATYAAGIADWYKLIKELYIAGWGLTTPSAIIVRYAPWGDNNNPVQYAANVTALVDSWQP